mmetsp:Transcript_13453/g.31608  ORF Transcript_13453/g.31608 Transcript_13453/m.31608 type:complete len:265 (-) Transcript_13453:2066-2860(-)
MITDQSSSGALASVGGPGAPESEPVLGLLRAADGSVDVRRRDPCLGRRLVPLRLRPALPELLVVGEGLAGEVEPALFGAVQQRRLAVLRNVHKLPCGHVVPGHVGVELEHEPVHRPPHQVRHQLLRVVANGHVPLERGGTRLEISPMHNTQRPSPRDLQLVITSKRVVRNRQLVGLLPDLMHTRPGPEHHGRRPPPPFNPPQNARHGRVSERNHSVVLRVHHGARRLSDNREHPLVRKRRAGLVDWRSAGCTRRVLRHALRNRH